MYKKRTVITNETGLHARPAAVFVIEAKKYESKIMVKKLNGDEVNAKSIVSLLAESMVQGTDIEISAKGADEQLAVDNLVDLVNSGFRDSTERSDGKCY